MFTVNKNNTRFSVFVNNLPTAVSLDTICVSACVGAKMSLHSCTSHEVIFGTVHLFVWEAESRLRIAQTNCSLCGFYSFNDVQMDRGMDG